MKLNPPKVTVVTVVRNGESTIEKTVVSVISQDYPNIEYIVVDGESRDETNSIINKYLDKIDIHISEPDRGIYDAMNKGARLASGEWILYMNAGDFFCASDSLTQMTNALNSDADVILAGVEEVLVDDYLETRYFQKMPRPLNEIWRSMPTSHQATLVRLSCQQKYNFDTSYIWCADHDLLARMYQDEKKFLIQNILFCVFDCNSQNSRDIMIHIRERWKLSKTLAPLYKRLIQYGGEWISCKILAKPLPLIKSLLPKSTVLKLRKLRGTSGTKPLCTGSA
jgi:glycosyltransferase involved in cell wall biosynthesis